MTTATLDNIRSWTGLNDTERKARLDSATIEFITPRYSPRRPKDMSDPRPTPDRVTDAMKAEIRERLGRGGNGLIGSGTATRRVDTANPDRPGRIDTGEPMRDRQRGLVMVLLERELRPINPEAYEAGLRWFTQAEPNMTKVQASDWIDRIRKMIAAGPSAPVHTTPQSVPQSVPQSKSPSTEWARWRELAARLVSTSPHPSGARFAVDTEKGAVNKIAFWWIVPGKGHNDGKFWLRQVIGGQGAVRVKMSVEAMISVAEKIIAAGPEAAMIRFGMELETCGACGRELTNDESRAAGIGPTCRKNKGE